MRKAGIEIRLVKKDARSRVASLAKAGRGEDERLVQHLTDGENATFFGYHDKTPFSGDGSKILACSVAAVDTDPGAECSRMEIGYFKKGDSGTFQPDFQRLTHTDSWCWQQGCMLQWNPVKPDREILFNRSGNHYHGSVVFDVEKRTVVNEFDTPIYSLDPKGRYAASLNFSRLGRLRPGYGYSIVPDPTRGVPAPSEDGVILLDLQNGETSLLVSLEELADYTDRQSEHYINHITFSPSGDRIVFFHIYDDRSGQRVIRMYLFDIPTSTLQLLEATRRVSHYCWRNDKQLFTTESGPTGGNCLYYLYDLETKSKKEIPLPNIGDLHPMFHPADPNILVADSKPDRQGNQHLFLFDIESGGQGIGDRVQVIGNSVAGKEVGGDGLVTHIGTFYSPDAYRGSVRCDLHPRWDREGRYVVVDTAEGGRRKMAVVEVKGI